MTSGAVRCPRTGRSWPPRWPKSVTKVTSAHYAPPESACWPSESSARRSSSSTARWTPRRTTSRRLRHSPAWATCTGTPTTSRPPTSATKPPSTWPGAPRRRWSPISRRSAASCRPSRTAGRRGPALPTGPSGRSVSPPLPERLPECALQQDVEVVLGGSVETAERSCVGQVRLGVQAGEQCLPAVVQAPACLLLQQRRGVDVGHELCQRVEPRLRGDTVQGLPGGDRLGQVLDPLDDQWGRGRCVQ